MLVKRCWVQAYCPCSPSTGCWDHSGAPAWTPCCPPGSTLPARTASPPGLPRLGQREGRSGGRWSSRSPLQGRTPHRTAGWRRTSENYTPLRPRRGGDPEPPCSAGPCPGSCRPGRWFLSLGGRGTWTTDTGSGSRSLLR